MFFSLFVFRYSEDDAIESLQKIRALYTEYKPRLDVH